MTGQWSATVAETIHLSGVAVSLVDYRWEAATSVINSEADIKLCWRVRPYKIKLTGGVTAGQTMNMGRLLFLQADAPSFFVGNQPGTLTAVECRFNRKWLMSQIPDEWQIVYKHLEPSFDFHNDKIDYVMRRIAGELLDPDAHTSKVIEAMAVSLSVELARHVAVINNDRERYGANIVFPRLAGIEQMVASSPTLPRIGDLATHFGISESHLRRLVKRATGRTVSDIVDVERLKRAEAMLLGTDMPINLIAKQLGYNQQSSFTFFFRHATGRSPLDFRRDFRQAH